MVHRELTASDLVSAALGDLMRSRLADADGIAALLRC
jgi:hypothetical protein